MEKGYKYVASISFGKEGMVTTDITNSFIRPVWQLPVNGAERTGNAYISAKAKYHCFEDNVSLCGKYAQDTSYYGRGITIEGGEILKRPNIACPECYRRWEINQDVEIKSELWDLLELE